MKIFETLISIQYFSIITVVLSCFILILLGYCIHLSKKIKLLSQTLFSLQRSLDHKETILETTVTKLAKGLPLAKHPATQEQHIKTLIEQLLYKFSLRLNKQLKQTLTQEQDIWHDKFSILLTSLGKTENDLRYNRDELFKGSWTSITELRQKSQLLFNDMKEDGIFYRMQSLWLITSLDLQQKKYQDAFRHSIAALKLYHDSKPTLPLSHKMAWNIGQNLLESESYLDKRQQQKLFNKFHLNNTQIVELFQELENFESNIEILQKIRIWNNNIVPF